MEKKKIKKKPNMYAFFSLLYQKHFFRTSYTLVRTRGWTNPRFHGQQGMFFFTSTLVTFYVLGNYCSWLFIIENNIIVN